jgi:hypothetical protein
VERPIRASDSNEIRPGILSALRRAIEFPPPPRAGWFGWLRRELTPFPDPNTAGECQSSRRASTTRFHT